MTRQVYKIEWQGNLYEIEAGSQEEAFSALPGYSAPEQSAPRPQEQDSTIPAENGNVGPFADRMGRFAKIATGAADLAVTGVRGTAGAISSGLTGLGSIMRGEDLNTVAQRQEDVMASVTGAPMTEAGRAGAEAIGKVLDPAMDKFREANMWLSGGNPELATLFETAILGAPEVITGARIGAGRRIRQSTKSEAYTQIEQQAASLGIDLNNNTVRNTVVEAARRLTEGTSRATSGIEDVREALVKIREAGQKRVNKLFEDARATKVALQYEPLRKAVDDIEAQLIGRGYDLSDNTALGKRIAELRALDTTIPGVPGKEAKRQGRAGLILGPDGKPMTPAGPVDIPLNELDLVQRKIGIDIDSATKGSPEMKALIRLRKSVQSHIDDQFVKDMVSGDKSAQKKWQAAYGASNTLRKNFNTNKIIARLVRDEATPMEVGNLILGASESKYKAQSLATVRKLKEVLGKDSPEFQSIKKAVMADLLDPLFKEKPNFRAVEERIRIRRKNDKAMLDELGIDNNELEIMRRASLAAEAAFMPADIDQLGLVTRMVTRYVAGHDIAKAAVRVKVANMLADKLLGVGQKTHAQLLREFAGQELSKPILDPGRPKIREVVMGGATVAAEQAAEDWKGGWF